MNRTTSMATLAAPWFALVASLVLSTAGVAQDTTKTAEKAPAEQVIKTHIGRSTVIKAPWPVKQVSVADPKTADVQVATPGQILLLGKSIGSTDVVMWSEDNQVWQARIDVTIDQSRIMTDLKALLPDSHLQLSQSQDVLVVTGTLAHAEDAARLKSYLTSVGIKYVDMARIAGVQQVQIKVRVAEVSRKATRALGVDMYHTGNDFFGGSSPGGSVPNIGVPSGTPAAQNLPFQFNTDTAVSAATTLLTGFPAIDLEVFIQALAENQYLRVLAEPNLVALNGEEASFLAGGEFPIPVVQGAGASSSGSSISVEYKEFGVRLQFRPVVLGDGSIRLKVVSEVSDITFVNGLQISGFNVPTLLARRAATTLELKSGQTFGMAGLLSRKSDAVNSRVPGLGDLPVLGTLFRSVRYETGDTELVVMVTADLVEPLSLGAVPPLPGVMHAAPSDWELYVEGRLESHEPARLSPADAAWFKEMGLNRLKGPGAWAAHGEPITRARPTIVRKAPEQAKP